MNINGHSNIRDMDNTPNYAYDTVCFKLLVYTGKVNVVVDNSDPHRTVSCLKGQPVQIEIITDSCPDFLPMCMKKYLFMIFVAVMARYI